MTKKEIKNADLHTLIAECVLTYGKLCVNINLGGGVKQLSQYCSNIEKELVSRGVLTLEDIERLS